jgi:hypothetical protein
MLPLVAVCGSVTIQQLSTGTLAGLDNLSYIGGAFFLAQNAMPWASTGKVDDISALSGLRYVGGAMTVAENYHLTKSDIDSSFLNLSVAGAVNIEFYDEPPSASGTAIKTGSVESCTLSSSETSEGACPSACMSCQEGGAADGGVALHSSGKCTNHCSMYGYCGITSIYSIGGTDCSACEGSTSPPPATGASVKGSFVVTLTGASSVLEDPVATAALEKSLAKHIALSLDVEGVTASGVTVVLSADADGGARRLRRLSSGVHVSYIIAVPASVADVPQVSAMAAQELNSKTPADMTIIVNDALQEASVEAPALANVQATDVRIKTAAVVETGQDHEDSFRTSSADHRRFGFARILLFMITSMCLVS